MKVVLVLLFYQFISLINCEKILNHPSDLPSDFIKDALINYFSQNVNYTDADVDQCQLQLISIAKNYNTNLNAFQVFDAWGKIPSGITYGHFYDIGNFDQCIAMSTELPDAGQFKGKYCRMQFPFNALPKSGVENLTKLSKLLLNERSHEDEETTITYAELGFGICIPSSCDPKRVQSFLSEALGGVSLKVRGCSTDTKEKFKSIDIVTLTIFGFLGVAMVLSSSYDYLTRGTNQKPLLLVCSVQRNAEKLFKLTVNKNENSIECLNGIRVLSMFWVIYGHSSTASLLLPTMNLITAKSWLSSFFSLFVEVAVISVDTFFLLSGLLISWVGMKELEKRKGKLNAPMMYFHRYLRLTPMLALAMLFATSMNYYFGSGPFWDVYNSISSKTCNQNWWKNLLYIQNYFEFADMCLPHSWYLAVDFQMFLFSPLILIGLWKWDKKFFGVMTCLSALSIGCIFGTFYYYDLKGVISTLDPENSIRQNKYYSGTQNRYSIWLIGIALGYVLYKTKNIKVTMSKLAVVTGWSLTLVLILTIVCGPYPTIQPSYKQTTFEGAIYESLSKIGWGFALSWIIFSCYHGYGGFINDLLSNPIWQPLGKLSFAMYISHLIIQMIVMGNKRTDNHFSDFDIVLQFWGHLGLTVCVSTILVLLVESPIIAMEKIAFSK